MYVQQIFVHLATVLVLLLRQGLTKCPGWPWTYYRLGWTHYHSPASAPKVQDYRCALQCPAILLLLRNCPPPKREMEMTGKNLLNLSTHFPSVVQVSVELLGPHLSFPSSWTIAHSMLALKKKNQLVYLPTWSLIYPPILQMHRIFFSYFWVLYHQWLR